MWKKLGCGMITGMAVLGLTGSAWASAPPAALTITPGPVVAIQKLHYRKLYEAKPFPEATITYHADGTYHIVSEGEDHAGVYVLQGDFKDETYTVRYISLPSPDWGNRTAFHQLTFITGEDARSGSFIQNAITDTGEAIAQQNGRYEMAPVPDPAEPEVEGSSR